jgi:hypothetical protein
MSINDLTLRARLSEKARPKVNKFPRGEKGHYDYQIGLTIVHLDQGLIFSKIGWGVDGTDIPVSGEVAGFVEAYDLGHRLSRRAPGIYVLKAKRGDKILARARVNESWLDKDKSDIFVNGAERKDVVKLFELVRDGKVRPEIEHVEFKQVEGALGELKRLRREVQMLRQELSVRDQVIADHEANTKALKEHITRFKGDLTQLQSAAGR